MHKSKLLVAAALTAGILSTTSFAADQQQFSALQGVQAEAMSSQEMAAVEGQITLTELTAAISTKFASQPKLAAYLIKYVTLIATRYPNLLPYLTAKYGI